MSRRKGSKLDRDQISITHRMVDRPQSVFCAISVQPSKALVTLDHTSLRIQVPSGLASRSHLHGQICLCGIDQVPAIAC